MHIKPLNPISPAAQSLLATSDAFMTALYPAVSNHLESAEALQSSNAYFIGTYIDDKLAACGAVKICADDGVYGEIKRIFVLEQYRGLGLSKALMQNLEAHLHATGVGIARLETGIRQPVAHALYAKLGYVVRGPFGGHCTDPMSVFMEKSIYSLE